MRMLAGCLLAALIPALGCLDMHGAMTAQQDAKKSPAASPAAPARPPVTEDQLTEANAAAMVKALTEELNRAERSVPD
jgi:hypothetical protein